MKKLVFALTLATICTSWPASAVPIVKRGYIPGAAPTLGCTIQVDFGSASTGPDMDTWGIIRNYLADNRDITEAEAWGWGKEGEFSLCIRVEDDKIVTKIRDDLMKLVPTVPAKNGGWTEVK